MTVRRLRPDGHRWLRVADPDWADPLDATWAADRGGRWNPPTSWPTLYLNRDVPTARAQVERLAAGAGLLVEELADDAYLLVAAVLPPGQRVLDVVTPVGVRDAGLAAGYPLDSKGEVTRWERCQRIGRRAHADGLDGVECRSAATPDGSGRELAWFPRGRTVTPTGSPRPLARW